MSEALTFKAQLSPLQSAMQHGPDGMLVKMIPQGMDAEMAADFYRLQECALNITIRDTMGDFTFNAFIPDTSTAVKINKKSPQVMFHIPKGDVLTGLRLVALFGVVFTVEASGGKAKAKTKKEKPLKGPYGRYWQAMYKHGALNSPDLPAALNTSETGEKAIKQAIKDWFDVSSLTFISPATFEDFCEHSQLHSLITISRQAEVEATDGHK